jgi:hypothetical protein
MGETSYHNGGFDVDHVLKNATMAEKLSLLAGQYLSFLSPPVF